MVSRNVDRVNSLAENCSTWISGCCSSQNGVFSYSCGRGQGRLSGISLERPNPLEDFPLKRAAAPEHPAAATNDWSAAFQGRQIGQPPRRNLDMPGAHLLPTVCANHLQRQYMKVSRFTLAGFVLLLRFFAGLFLTLRQHVTPHNNSVAKVCV